MFQNKRCKNCFFSKYHKSDCLLGCGYTCHLNPFRPVVMGLLGKHSDRKGNKKEQYSKKDS